MLLVLMLLVSGCSSKNEDTSIPDISAGLTESSTSVEESEEVEAQVMVGTINTDAVNIRSEATTDSSKYGQASDGDVFYVKELLTEWTMISYEDGVAYIYNDYIEVEMMDESQAAAVADPSSSPDSSANTEGVDDTVDTSEESDSTSEA